MSVDVLIIEDQDKIARLIGDYLHAAGLSSAWRRSGISLSRDLEELRPRLVVLDLMLPGRDGLSLCRDIRERSDCAVIMVTARIEEMQRLEGFAAGADDYLCKPFSPRELVARAKAVLARMPSRSVEEWRSGPLLFDDGKLRVEGPAGHRCLGALQYRLLSTLGRRPGQVFSREQLIEALHEDRRDLNDRTIDSHIRSLRSLLTAIAPEEALIETVYGAGYRFRREA